MCCQSLPAQVWRADTSRNVVERHINQSLDLPVRPTGTKRADIPHILKYVEQVQYVLPDSAVVAAEQARELARKYRDQNLEAISCYWLAWAGYIHQSINLDQLKVYIDMSLELLPNNAHSWRAKLYALKAAIYAIESQPEQSMTDLEEALRITKFIQAQPQDSMWVIAFSEGIRSALVNSIDSILYHLENSLQGYHLISDHAGIARASKNLALIYISQSDSTYANLYLQEAIKQYASIGFQMGLKESYRYDGIFSILMYGQTKDERWFDRGRNSFLNALTIAAGSLDCDVINRLGIAYHQKAVFLTPSHPAFSRYLDSIRYYYEQGLILAENEMDTTCLQILISNTAKLCPFTNNCDSILLQTSDLYSGILKNQMIQRDQAQQQIEAFREEQSAQRRRNLIAGGSVGGAGLLFIFLFFYQRQRIQGLDRELQAKSTAWRAQMNPHFISNALNAIDSLINEERNVEASDYIIQFARLSRMVLDSSVHPEIPLADEIELLEYYLSLEQLRLVDQLTYTVEIIEDIDLRKIAVPSMLLQPFVENAIWHGIQPKETPGSLEIKIRKSKGQLLICTIEDDGIGRAKSQELKKSSILKRESLGLSITKDRIQILKKKGGRLEIEDLTSNGEPAGTRVIISLPLKAIENDNN